MGGEQAPYKCITKPDYFKKRVTSHLSNHLEVRDATLNHVFLTNHTNIKPKYILWTSNLMEW